MRSLSTAATGMLAQQLNVDVIANNIANMNTTGFKRARAEFQDLIYSQQNRVGGDTSADATKSASGIQIGSGVRAAGVYRINEQGALQQTGNRFDIAVEGRGYFTVALPGGEKAYTRAGSFQLSDVGELVTPEGYRVEPGITVPQEATDVVVSKTGLIQVKMPGSTQLQTVGQLELAAFVNDAGLEALGSNLFKETPASGAPTTGMPGSDGMGTLAQGFVEGSNVSAVAEITDLIKAQRAYEMNSRVVKASDEMLQSTSNLR